MKYAILEISKTSVVSFLLELFTEKSNDMGLTLNMKQLMVALKKKFYDNSSFINKVADKL